MAINFIYIIILMVIFLFTLTKMGREILKLKPRESLVKLLIFINALLAGIIVFIFSMISQ